MNSTNIIAPLAGGLLIGLGAVGLMLFSGRIAGISGIFSGLLAPKAGDLGWRLSFVAGLIAGGVVLVLAYPAAFASQLSLAPGIIILGGLLVGFGARLGSGCTSGHGVCGVARLGPRSLVATATFMTTGAVAAVAVRHLL